MKRIYYFFLFLFVLSMGYYVSAKEVQFYFYANGATSSSSNVVISDEGIALKTGDYYASYQNTDTITAINSINGQTFTLTKSGKSLVAGREWYAYDKNYNHYLSFPFRMSFFF